MRKKSLIITSFFAFIFNINAQDGFENILLADEADVNKLMSGYFSPAMEGFIHGLNNGWYHTAKVHKKFGFDITIGGSGAMVPSEREIFSLTGLTSATGASEAPTFAGENTETTLTVTKVVSIPGQGSQTVTAPLTLPGGVKDDLPLNGAIPAPTVQVSVGLPFKTEAIVRFVPKTNFGDDEGELNMFGIGLKKEITSWFGPMDKLPLHVSLLAAYSTMDVAYEIGDENTEVLTIQDGLASFDLNSFTVQAIASLNFPIINLYGGFGYNNGNANLNMTGTYQGKYTYNIDGTQYTETLDLNTPDVDFSTSGVSTTLGARLSLGFFKIFGSYTFQEFNTLNAGIAFSFR